MFSTSVRNKFITLIRIVASVVLAGLVVSFLITTLVVWYGVVNATDEQTVPEGFTQPSVSDSDDDVELPPRHHDYCSTRNAELLSNYNTAKDSGDTTGVSNALKSLAELAVESDCVIGEQSSTGKSSISTIDVVTGVDQQISKAILKFAEKTNLTIPQASAVAWTEGVFMNTRNFQGTPYEGLFQVGLPASKDAGYTAEQFHAAKTNPILNAEIAAAYSNYNFRWLNKNCASWKEYAKALEISKPALVYLPHQQGPRGLCKILQVLNGVGALPKLINRNIRANLPARLNKGTNIERAKALVTYYNRQLNNLKIIPEGLLLQTITYYLQIGVLVKVDLLSWSEAYEKRTGRKPKLTGASGPPKFVVDISTQSMKAVVGGNIVLNVPVSTSKYGVGSTPGSKKTPIGRHQIVTVFVGEPIKDGFVTKFTARVPAGKVKINRGSAITSLVLTLKGLETRNRTSWNRRIYIHGTQDERSIGEPSSEGCVRITNKAAFTIYNMFGRNLPGSLVIIQE